MQILNVMQNSQYEGLNKSKMTNVNGL